MFPTPPNATNHRANIAAGGGDITTPAKITPTVVDKQNGAEDRYSVGEPVVIFIHILPDQRDGFCQLLPPQVDV